MILKLAKSFILFGISWALKNFLMVLFLDHCFEHITVFVRNTNLLIFFASNHNIPPRVRKTGKKAEIPFAIYLTKCIIIRITSDIIH